MLARLGEGRALSLERDVVAHAAHVAQRPKLLASDATAASSGRPAPLDFRAGQRIRTEYSCKYAIEEFEQLAGRAGWGPICAWTDPDALFSLQLFRAA